MSIVKLYVFEELDFSIQRLKIFLQIKCKYYHLEIEIEFKNNIVHYLVLNEGTTTNKYFFLNERYFRNKYPMHSLLSGHLHSFGKENKTSLANPQLHICY